MAAINNLIIPQLKRILVPVPEIQEDGEIIISELNALVIDQKNNRPDDSIIYFMAMVVCASAIREDGTNLMDIRNYRDLASQLDFTVLDRLYDAAGELNGFTVKSVAKAKKPLKKAGQ